MRERTKPRKQRNWIAVAAWDRTGAGPHKDKREYRRFRHSTNDYLDEYFEELEEDSEDE